MDDVELAKRATALCLDSEPWTLGLRLLFYLMPLSTNGVNYWNTVLAALRHCGRVYS